MWVDGDVGPADEARIGALDRGLLLGEGVYDTCSVVDGMPFALTRHLARLRRSAAIVGIDVPWSDSAIRAACARTVGAALVGRTGTPSPDDAVGRLRITVTGGVGPLGPLRGSARPSLIVAVGPAPKRGETAAVSVVAGVRNPAAPTVGAKVTSALDLVLALAAAQRRGADEAILTTPAGHLAEGSGSNLFLVVDGRLATPDLATGCLPGVTRDLVLELLDGTDLGIDLRADLTVADLHGASEAFLTSTTRRVQAVASVDGTALGAAPGPVTAAVLERFAALEASTIDP